MMMKQFRYSKAGLLLAMTVVLAAVSLQTFAATLTVTNLADSGAGTLRDRIAAAVPGDTIMFGVLGTITLNSELVISRNVRIDGGLANGLRISGNNHSRVFNVTNGTAQIFNMTIRDGRVAGTNGPTGFNGENVYGGGIRVASGATLDLENCIVSNNVALGGQGGPASQFGSAGNGGNGYGGGIASLGSLTMVRCTLVANSGTGGLGGPSPSPGSGGQGWGGAMYLEGSALMFYSTIYANNALAGSGGGGPGGSIGGGIYSIATLNVNSSTIASNTATGSSTDSGGGIGNNGTLTVRDSTIIGNQADFGGGITGGDIGNTILAANSASSPAAGPDGHGPIVSSDYNLIQNTNGITFSGITTHNITGQNPLLGPLQYNGGPDISYLLLTISPLAGSPAIDNGKSSFSTDQRGFTRPYDTNIPDAVGGNGADIGAVEVHPTRLFVSNTNDSGAGSLRQAILDNNGLGGSNSIYFSNNVVGTITLTSGSLVMTAPGEVIGPGPNVLAISGNHNGRIFDIRDGPTSISGLTVRDGLVVGTAGVLGQPGFEERGGGIYNQGAALMISNCFVLSNSVIGGMGGSPNFGSAGNGGRALGGGLHNIGANVTVAYCLFDANSSTGGQGGAAANASAGFGGNGIGGAISTVAGGMFKVIACEFKNGLAKGGGAGLGNPSGVGGQGYGGGLYSESTLSVLNSTIAGNSATGGDTVAGGGPGSGNGGGGYSFTTWAFTNCTIANNTAIGSSFDSGGGLSSQGTLTIFNSTIAGNQADYGGGLSANADMGNTILAGNTATTDGPDGTGTILSEDYNLIQTFNGLAVGGATTHVLIGVDPLLGPLANNGGPTRTFALHSGSPAIDHGKNFGPLTDQRGAPRPFDFASVTNASGGDGSDIGAVELGRPTLIIQKFSTDAVLLWPYFDGDFTLQSVTNLAAAGSWANVAGTPVVVGSQYVVTNGPISGNRFFRLKAN